MPGAAVPLVASDAMEVQDLLKRAQDMLIDQDGAPASPPRITPKSKHSAAAEAAPGELQAATGCSFPIEARSPAVRSHQSTQMNQLKSFVG